PEHGYYMTQSPFGSQGDFTTAPEISQVFGELIGAWLMHSWEEIGAPTSFNLIELGPGRGTLMRDILRTARIRPEFIRAAHIQLVEMSPVLRQAQQELAQHSTAEISWVREIAEIPPAPSLIVGNEFLDCLPIRQFVRTTRKQDPCWRERLVGVETLNEKERLKFALADDYCETPVGAPNNAKPEDIFEVCEATLKVVQQIAQLLHAHQGRALLIDYGHAQSGFGDTLQALQNHQYCAPLDKPGFADVTAHVDFERLACTARQAGLAISGPIPQAIFLGRLGLAARAQALVTRLSRGDVKRLETGIRRLVHPEEMGTLFKAICLSSKGLPPPAGFTD
ncbi:MAG: SAM-dependent methyltransferase, partial [Aquisalinus sp.]|nr:SAM-dependent methyltransferase [Aquisalinus sp.]